jgi:uncharacterized protein (DUF486 family)
MNAILSIQWKRGLYAPVAAGQPRPFSKRRKVPITLEHERRIPMLWTALLLTISNVFMTFAWYGHLKHTKAALWLTILVSWGIAFFEYCFQVPANRMGYKAGMSGAQLKILQEAITICVFIVFAVLYLKEQIQWKHIAAFALVVAAVIVVNIPTKQDVPAHGAEIASNVHRQ